MSNRFDGMSHETHGALKERVGEPRHNRSGQLASPIDRRASKADQMIALINDRKRQSNDARRRAR